MTTRFTTDTLSPADRADAWREVSSSQFVPLEPAPIGSDSAFKAKLVADTFADCGWAIISTTRHTVRRTTSTIRQAAPGTVFVNMQLRGDGTLQQGDRNFAIHPGDIAVIDTDSPFILRYDESMRMACFSMPKDVYNITSHPRVISQHSTQGAVLGAYLRGLVAGGIHSALDGKPLANEIAILLARCRDLRSDQSSRIIHELSAIIEIHLSDARLSSTRLAELLHISRSRLYELLATQNLTVHGMLLTARLDRAEQLLCEQRSVTTASEAVGFVDPGTFTRAFKKRHGVTPSVWLTNQPEIHGQTPQMR